MFGRTSSPTKSPRRESLLRQVTEFFVCLVLAVVLFKTFEAEGYLISTGSMAPTLLGYHKRVRCPSCGIEFAVGVPEGPAPLLGFCPNCGQYDIDLRALPRNDGDQLLVHKTAFEFRPPRRWESAVFHNPQQPSEAYVKRIIGLPGEEIELRHGDVYIDGKIATKPLDVQRNLALPVYDQDYRPPATDPQWRPRWVPETPWKQDEGRFVFADQKGGKELETAPLAWLRYQQWVRAGGTYETWVPLEKWPQGVDFSDVELEPLHYNFARKQLGYWGAMSQMHFEELAARVPNPDFQRALIALYDATHHAPVMDEYAYNRSAPGNGGDREVRDLLLSVQLKYLGGNGEIRFGITDGIMDLECVCDLPYRQLRLEQVGQKVLATHEPRVPLRTGPLPEILLEQPVTIEISLMDRRFQVAVDGELALEPWDYPEPPRNDTVPPPSAPRQPVRIGARGVGIEVAHLRLFRDVYYTLPDRPRLAKFPRLRDTPGQEEYFVLGDNSPVSVDSRFWPMSQRLTRDMLIGKPFLVHLPAKTAIINWGGRQGQIRIPDWSRVRYIH